MRVQKVVEREVAFGLVFRGSLRPGAPDALLMPPKLLLAIVAVGASASRLARFQPKRAHALAAIKPPSPTWSFAARSYKQERAACNPTGCQCDPILNAGRKPASSVFGLNRSSAPPTARIWTREDKRRADLFSSCMRRATAEFLDSKRARDVCMLSSMAAESPGGHQPTQPSDERASSQETMGRRMPLWIALLEWIKRACRGTVGGKDGTTGSQRTSAALGWWGNIRSWIHYLVADLKQMLRSSISQLSTLLFLTSIVIMSFEI